MFSRDFGSDLLDPADAYALKMPFQEFIIQALQH